MFTNFKSTKAAMAGFKIKKLFDVTGQNSFIILVIKKIFKKFINLVS